MKKIVDSEVLDRFFDDLEDVSENMLDLDMLPMHNMMIHSEGGKLQLDLKESVKIIDLHKFILGEFFEDDPDYRHNLDTKEMNKDLFLGIENLYKESKKLYEDLQK